MKPAIRMIREAIASVPSKYQKIKPTTTFSIEPFVSYNSSRVDVAKRALRGLTYHTFSNYVDYINALGSVCSCSSKHPEREATPCRLLRRLSQQQLLQRTKSAHPQAKG